MTSGTAEETKSIIIKLLDLQPKTTISNLCNKFQDRVGHYIPFRMLGFMNIEAYLRSMPDIVKVIGSGYYAKLVAVNKSNITLTKDTEPTQSTDIIPNRKILKLETETNKGSQDCKTNNVTFSPDHLDDKYLKDSGDEVSGHRKVPEKILQNLKKLMSQLDYKFKPSELSEIYRETFDETLNYENYGYKSVQEMCLDLPEIFIMFGDKIPSHVFPPGQRMSRIALDNNFHVGDYFEVEIADVYDISKFWIYLKTGELERLMIQLQNYFNNLNNRLLVPQVLLQKGLYCVSLYYREYHRALIVDVLVGLVKVFFVDYGTVDYVCPSSIWYLPRKFAYTPCKLIRTRLSNIWPKYERTMWSYSSTLRFRQLTENKTLVVNVTGIIKKDNILEVYLADVTDKQDITYINDTLVNEGFAVYTNQKQKSIPLDPVPKFNYFHLYPEFIEIESGRAPTQREMEYYAENNMAVHHYLPDYFQIDLHEDIDDIEKDHEYFMKSTNSCEIALDSTERPFDFSIFPECLSDEIRKIVNKIAQSDVTTYSYAESINQVEEKINSDLESLSLIGDCSVLNNSPKSTNPFLTVDPPSDTNPFRTTNPFFNNLEFEGSVDTSQFVEFFSKENTHNLNPQLTETPEVSEQKSSTNPFLDCEDENCNQFSENEGNICVRDASLVRVRPPPGFYPEMQQVASPIHLELLNQMLYSVMYFGSLMVDPNLPSMMNYSFGVPWCPSDVQSPRQASPPESLYQGNISDMNNPSSDNDNG